MVTRVEVLNNAAIAINGERQEQYGSPEENFEAIAEMWTAYLGHMVKITASDVPAMMILLKVARQASGVGSDDNWVDIAGYAACGGEIYSRDLNKIST